jgi:peptidoglycan hydrolase-like protein with peptidoglycan-binding domain
VPFPAVRRPLVVSLVIAAAFGLLAANASAARLGTRTLRTGAHGTDVRTLQRLLTKAGFRVSVDGMFGRATARAVRLFQREQGLRVTGYVASRDARALRGTLHLGQTIGGGMSYAEQPAPGQDPEAAPQPVTPPPTGHATVGPDGLATAPSDAPPEVQAIIAAGNRIATKPYRYGGGHGRWNDTGYDCSGSVSFALHGAGLLDTSLDSTGFERWGQAGRGQWVTIYSNSGHAYMVVAGLRFDTSGRASRTDTRWHAERRSASGYVVRHPPGL